MHTSKTFKLIAETIRTRIAAEKSVRGATESALIVDSLLDLALDFAHHFANENPRFDKVKFMAAVKK